MKITTEYIKTLIPTLLTDEALKHIQSQFTEDLTPMHADLKNPKHWKRESKNAENSKIVRCFDFRPLDGQLRLYIYSDSTDTNFIGHEFLGE